MATIDLQAIAAFLNPSLQQNLGGNFSVETFQLESCLVIKLVSEQILPQPLVIETIQADLALFQLNGIMIIRVTNWYRPDSFSNPELLWSQDISKFHQIELVQSVQSNPLLSDIKTYTPIAQSSFESPEVKSNGASSKGVKSKPKFGVIHLLLILLLVAIASGVGALIKISNNNDFEPSPSLPSVPNPPKLSKNPSIDPPTRSKEPDLEIPKVVAETSQDPKNTLKKPTVFATRSNTPANKTEITLAQYNRITIGMTVSEVEKIIGIQGRLLYDNRTGEITAQLYSWKNPEGSNAIVEFRDDKVESKNQAGL